MEVVSERLGHGGPVFTMPVHQSVGTFSGPVTPDMQADAAKLFREAI